MKNCFNGLSTINLELTSRCNKNCWMCGRRSVDKNYPEIAMKYGDMDFELLKKLSKEIPEDIITVFHSNGEPLLYPYLKKALQLFPNNIRCFDTNGILLLEKAKDIINNMETLTISVFENDPLGDKQYDIVVKFLEIKGDKKPYMIYRLLGEVKNPNKWEKLPGIVAKRILHHPLGNYKYKKKEPTKPEGGICLDLLNHLVIDRFGRVFPCVRFDPEAKQCIGDVNKDSLYNIWNSDYRKEMIKYHIKGDRSRFPICKDCKFWGVPTG